MRASKLSAQVAIASPLRNFVSDIADHLGVEVVVTTMRDTIGDILFERSPCEIIKPVVGRISIQVAHDSAFGALAYKRQQDEPVNTP